jgi:hypothetical protein
VKVRRACLPKEPRKCRLLFDESDWEELGHGGWIRIDCRVSLTE